MQIAFRGQWRIFLFIFNEYIISRLYQHVDESALSLFLLDYIKLILRGYDKYSLKQYLSL